MQIGSWIVFVVKELSLRCFIGLLMIHRLLLFLLELYYFCVPLPPRQREIDYLKKLLSIKFRGEPVSGTK